jgi:hypothetical protein
LNSYDISSGPKTAERLLEIVLEEIKFATEVLKLNVVAWCTDASGELATMQKLLVHKIPSVIAVDCWCHQVDLVIGDIFKGENQFVAWIDNALKVVEWFNNHTQATRMLRDAQRIVLGNVICLILPAQKQWTSYYLAMHRLLQLELVFKRLLLDSREELVCCTGDNPDAKLEAHLVIELLEGHDFWANLRKYTGFHCKLLSIG